MGFWVVGVGVCVFFARVGTKGIKKQAKRMSFEPLSAHIGLGGRQWLPENQQHYQEVKTTANANVSFEMWGSFLKIWRAQRLDVYCGIMKKK